MQIFWRKRNKASYIKEAFDNLPMGVCFFDAEGMPVLYNHKMYQLAYLLSGRDIQHQSEMEQMLGHPAPGVEKMDENHYRLPGGTIWQFEQIALTDEAGRTFTRITASDVTELYQLKETLKSNMEKQEQLSRRMRVLSENVVALIREEETLNLKMRIHDDIGKSVIATKQLLEQNRPVEELNMAIWRDAISVLKRDNLEKQGMDALGQLLNAAEILGVRILMEGSLPQEEKQAYMLIAAIRECMTNVRTHAEGDELYVKLERAPKEIRMSVKNNGNPPRGLVREGGGLSSLRKRIKRAGGRMEIISAPQFELRVILDERAEELW